MNELRRNEGVRVDRAGFAARPAFERVLAEVVDVHVARGLRGFGGEGEALAGCVELQIADSAVRHAGRRQLELHLVVEHGETAAAVFVDHVRDVAAIGADIERIDVPVEIGRTRALVVRDRVVVAQPRELAVFVGDEIDAAAVRREPRRLDADLAVAVRLRPACGFDLLLSGLSSASPSSGVTVPLATSATNR